MKNIKITENQLKMLIEQKEKIKEQSNRDRSVLRHLNILLGDSINSIEGNDLNEAIALIKGSLELLYDHQGNLNTPLSDEKIVSILNQYRDEQGPIGSTGAQGLPGNDGDMNEQLDMEDSPGMDIKIGMAVMSHLSDIQEMGIGEDANDRINFVKKLVTKYPNMEQKITTKDLDAIYNEMLGGGDDIKKPNMDIDDNPFSDGYDFSMNESIKEIKKQFKRYI